MYVCMYVCIMFVCLFVCLKLYRSFTKIVINFYDKRTSHRTDQRKERKKKDLLQVEIYKDMTHMEVQRAV